MFFLQKVSSRFAIHFLNLRKSPALLQQTNFTPKNSPTRPQIKICKSESVLQKCRAFSVIEIDSSKSRIKKLS